MRACITDVVLAEVAFQNGFSKRDGFPPLQDRLAFRMKKQWLGEITWRWKHRSDTSQALRKIGPEILLMGFATVWFEVFTD